MLRTARFKTTDLEEKVAKKTSVQRTMKRNLLIGKGGVIINDYTFSADLILQNVETCALFKVFLEKEHNLEPFDFVTHVEELEKMIKEATGKSDSSEMKKKIAEKLSFIDKEFLAEGAKKEINISGQMRREISEALASTKQDDDFLMKENSPIAELLHEVKSLIIGELERDNLSRFLRSNAWITFITGKSESFVQSVGSKRESLSNIRYSMKDFVEQIVTDKDFEIARQLGIDSYDWGLQGHQKNSDGCASAYYGHVNYFPDIEWITKGGSIAKYEGILNFPFDAVVNTLMSINNLAQYDGNCYRYKPFKYVTNSELKASSYASSVQSKNRSVSLGTWYVKLPWPMTTVRLFHFVSSFEYDPANEQVIMVNRPTTLPEEEVKKIRAEDKNISKALEMKDILYWIITKVDEKRTSYKQIHIGNLSGWATNPTLHKMAVFERARIFQKSCVKFMDNTVNKGKPIKKIMPDEDDHYMRMIKELEIPKQRKEYQAISGKTTRRSIRKEN